MLSLEVARKKPRVSSFQLKTLAMRKIQCVFYRLFSIENSRQPLIPPLQRPGKCTCTSNCNENAYKTFFLLALTLRSLLSIKGAICKKKFYSPVLYEAEYF